MVQGRYHNGWFYKDATLRRKLDESGCRFEELILGAQLLRIIPDLRKLMDDETRRIGFFKGILGLAIMSRKGDISGYRTIPDEIIRGIVDSGGKLPLNQDCFEELVEDIRTQSIYKYGRFGPSVFVRELKQSRCAVTSDGIYSSRMYRRHFPLAHCGPVIRETY
jgi:hypothetical protein